MIKPVDLDLPSKFKEFRPNQFEIASKIVASTKYAYLLDAATGTGKSLLAATVQKIMGKNIVYTCMTKQLQDQILHDFPYARILKGRQSYPCNKYPKMYPEITAEECSKTENNSCDYENNCYYLRAKTAALGAPIAVLNLAYFLSEANYVGTFSDLDFLVVDEFDAVEDQLMSFVEVVLTSKQLNELNLEKPRYVTKFDSWVEWAQAAIKILTPRLEHIQHELSSSWATTNFSLMKEERKLSRLLKKLRFFVSEVDKNWVWLSSTDRWAFKPIWIAKYAHDNLWKHSKRILGMSATILDPIQICVNIGLKYDDCVYKLIPSPFPKENRPIRYEPCSSVTAKTMDTALPALKAKIEHILSEYPDDKILCHCVTYKIRDYLIKNIKSTRLMTHDTFNRADVLESFKTDKRPRVLISPSMDRGVDLPQDECRVIIIAKVPFSDLGDPQINKRVYASKDGRRWYIHKAVSKIIQMSGRGVRSVDDYAITYILDEQFDRIYKENKNLFPPWYREAIIY